MMDTTYKDNIYVEIKKIKIHGLITKLQNNKLRVYFFYYLFLIWTKIVLLKFLFVYYPVGLASEKH